MLRAGVLLAILVVLLVGLASAAAPASAAAAAARGHRCTIDLPSGFPGITELRATRTGCRDARGVARWIWVRIHRKSLKGEAFELPETVGPVRGRTFSCGYHGVQDGDAFFYAARCSSGRAVVRLHLNS